MTQEAFAEYLKVSRSTVSGWETGRSYPDLDTVVEIGKLFNVSLDTLLHGDEDVVQQITKDTRVRKRNHFFILLLISILSLIFCYLLYYRINIIEAGPNDVAYTKKVDDKVEIHFKRKFLYTYQGSMSDYAVGQASVNVKVWLKFDLFGNTPATVEVPLTEETKQIYLATNESYRTKMLYDSND
jgi:transcriptional regulator with XRE-family HTH domain